MYEIDKRKGGFDNTDFCNNYPIPRTTIGIVCSQKKSKFDLAGN